MAKITKDALRERIELYIGDKCKDVKVFEGADKLFVELTYEDFKTDRMVREAIEAMGDNVVVRSIERQYSDSVVVDVIEDIGKVWIMRDDESLVRMNLYTLIDEKLMDMDFSEEE